MFGQKKNKIDPQKEEEIRKKLEQETGLKIVSVENDFLDDNKKKNKNDPFAKKRETTEKISFEKLEETKLKKISPQEQKEQTKRYGTTFFLQQSWLILKRLLRLLEKNQDVTRLSLLCIFSVLFGVFLTLLVYKLALTYLAGGLGTLVAVIITFIKKLATPPGDISKKLQKELREKRTDLLGRTLFDHSDDDEGY